MYTQTRSTLDTILWALDQAGATVEDLVNTTTWVTDLAQYRDHTRARLDVLGATCPTATLLVNPALIHPEMMVEIESDAIIGASALRRDIFTGREREKASGYARAVEVGDWVHVSGSTSLNDQGEVQAAGDWAAQYDLAHETIQRALAEAGASLDDVVCKRTFTIDGAIQNRPHGEGPAWFANSCPASMGCRIAALALPGLLVEVEALALKGAHANIEWIGPGAVDPLG